MNMKLLEFFHEFDKTFHNASEDESKARSKDARKTRLTLQQINKLRRIDDMRKIEHERGVARLKLLYGPKEQPGGDLGI